MKKIIHLSDTHSGYENLTNKLADIVTRMIFHKTPAKNYIVVITGDIVDDATREGSYEEVNAHLDRLRQAGFTVLAVPGNHDYGTGAEGSIEYVDRFKKHFFGGTHFTYPKLDIIDNTAFIGLDSMAEELNWYDRLFAQGELGEEQLKRLGIILESKEVKKCQYRVVYLHHHPFHPKLLHSLRDSKELGKTLMNHQISTLLFGHNHDGRVWNGGWGIKRVYDGGTSTNKGVSQHDSEKRNPHRIIDLSTDPRDDYDAQF